MEVLYKIKEIKNLSLALGFFDGVHLAHKKIIENTVNLAEKNSIKSALITFLDSPYYILNKVEPFYLTTREEKINLIKKEGIDYLFILDFEEFKNLEAREYIQNVLIKYFSPKIITTGFNHTFGVKGLGNPELLREEKSFEYIEIPPVKINDELISSTNIRNKILNGDFIQANKMLGRNFSIQGEIVRGNQIARKLGYKTANLIWKKNIIRPPYGVYSGFCTVKNKRYKALINFGIRPSVDKNLTETLEVHILDFNQDIYGELLNVEFKNRIRGEIKFNSLDELKNQIDKDYNIISVQNSTNNE